MLCALLDSIENLVSGVRCADFSHDGCARDWFEGRGIQLFQSQDEALGPFDFLIGEGLDRPRLETLIAEDGIALLRLPAQIPSPEENESWSRIAHVVSGRLHWQLWRRGRGEQQGGFRLAR